MKNPSRKKAAIISAFTHYSTTVFLIVQGIVLVPLYIRFAGEELYGAWLATGSIIGYLGLLDMGLGSVISQQVAAYAGKGDTKELAPVIATGLLVSVVPALCIIILGACLRSYIAGWVGLPDSSSILSQAFFLATLATAAMIVACGFGGIFLGLQRAGVISIQYIIATVLGIVVTIYLLYQGRSILAIAAGMLARALFVAVGHALYFIYWITRKESPALYFDRQILQAILKKSLWVFLSRSAGNIARRSDALIVATIAGPAQTTMLTITQKASDIIRIFIDRTVTACTPGIAHLFGESFDPGRVRNRIDQIARVIIWMAVIGLGGFCLMNREFIQLWLADQAAGKHYGGASLTGLIAISALALTCSNLLNTILFAHGKIELTSRMMILEVIVRLPLTLLFCYWWGIIGVVIATIISLLIVALTIQIRMICQTLRLSPQHLLHKATGTLVRSMIPVALFAMIHRLWQPQSLIQFSLFSTAYFITGCLAVLWVERDLRDMVLRLIQKKFSFKHPSPNSAITQS